MPTLELFGIFCALMLLLCGIDWLDDRLARRATGKTKAYLARLSDWDYGAERGKYALRSTVCPVQRKIEAEQTREHV